MKYILLFTLVCYSALTHSQTPFTLKDCLEEGLEKNYSVRIARNEGDMSKNNATIANAGYLPTLDLSAGYDGSLDNINTTPRNGDSYTDNGIYDQVFNAGLNLNWTLFDGFKISTTYEKLKELEKMGETNTRIAIEDFIAGLTSEYYSYVQEQIRLKNLRYAVSLSKERLRIVQSRYEIGSFSRLDLQQAKVDFNADSAKLLKQQELVISSRIRLNEMMACERMDYVCQVADTTIGLDLVPPVDQLWENTLKTNASLLKAEQNHTLSELDLKTVNSRNYPYLKLNSRYGYTFNKYGSGTYTQRNNWGLDVGVTIGINLFDGNRRSERKNARIAIENAKLQRDELELGLKADLSNLWQAYQNNLELLKLERDNLIAARENLDIAMERYMLGNLSGIEMREAQKSLLDAEERILSAEYDTKICEISLKQISGNILDYLQE